MAVVAVAAVKLLLLLDSFYDFLSKWVPMLERVYLQFIAYQPFTHSVLLIEIGNENEKQKKNYMKLRIAFV